MPVRIPSKLPATQVLKSENIFVMTEECAKSKNIRQIRMLILNLMPTKIVTETQLSRMLSVPDLEVDIELLKMATHTSKNAPLEHMNTFYKTFDEVKDNSYDGMIITGAPVELLEFEDVTYWDELCTIMDWAISNVKSTLYICWGAQAGLYHHYGIQKFALDKKAFGIFEHKILEPKLQLFHGFDNEFFAPHSRHTEICGDDIKKVSELDLLSTSEEVGVYALKSSDNRQFFITGHPEYDTETLAFEYFRDVKKGLEIDIPKNYFLSDNPENPPLFTWQKHAQLLYANWLNYYVSQG